MASPPLIRASSLGRRILGFAQAAELHGNPQIILAGMQRQRLRPRRPACKERFDHEEDQNAPGKDRRDVNEQLDGIEPDASGGAGQQSFELKCSAQRNVPQAARPISAR